MALERKLIGSTDLQVCRLGLAGRYGLPRDDIVWALENGLDYLWWQPGWPEMTFALQGQLTQRRERLVIAAATDRFDGVGTIKELDGWLQTLGTDYLDIFMFHYVDSQAQWDRILQGGLDTVHQARSQGKVRYISFTAHNRPLAAKLVASGAFDIATIRYSCAHVGAEEEVFPVVQEHHCGVVVFTALRWGTLLWPPRGERAPTTPELYRFALEHPAVDVVMTAPRTRDQLVENMRAVEDGFRLSPQRLEELRAYGQRFREHMA